jgi:hypothetical protein
MGWEGEGGYERYDEKNRKINIPHKDNGEVNNCREGRYYDNLRNWKMPNSTILSPSGDLHVHLDKECSIKTLSCSIISHHPLVMLPPHKFSLKEW